jgi:hypothetical protein
MQFKDHTQTPPTWPTRRAQRCLIFAILFMFVPPHPPLFSSFLIKFHSLISTIGICERQFWPRSTELQLDRIKGLYAPYTYTSIPEEGMPRLQFKYNAVRKATEEPFFQWVYEEEVVMEAEEPLVLTPEEMENGKLIGVQPQ